MEACADQQCRDDGAVDQPHATRGACGESNQASFSGWGWEMSELMVLSLRDMWNEGPGGPHYEMMASSRYTKVSCGFAELSNGWLWGVQDYY